MQPPPCRQLLAAHSVVGGGRLAMMAPRWRGAVNGFARSAVNKRAISRIATQDLLRPRSSVRDATISYVCATRW